jgi:hypothetical protein
MTESMIGLELVSVNLSSMLPSIQPSAGNHFFFPFVASFAFWCEASR